jgi:hypothetical protein
VAIAILTFSSLVYFAEKEDRHDITTKDTSWTFVESFWYIEVIFNYFKIKF